MPRLKNPDRLDAIVAAATATFIDQGFDRAKIAQIADRAKIGPGTVYLYVEDKEALFELTVLRALESPAVAVPTFPYRKSTASVVRERIETCLHQIAHFPQLWVAAERREDSGIDDEVTGVFLEIARWLERYRSAILLAERNRGDRPDLATAFDAIVWTDLHRRLTGYLGARMRGGRLVPVGDPALVARFAIDGLTATLVAGPLALTEARPRDLAALVRLAAAPVLGSGYRLPFPTDAGEDPGV